MESKKKIADITFKNLKAEAFLSLFPCDPPPTRDEILAEVNRLLDEKQIQRGYVDYPAVQRAADTLLATKQPQSGVLMARGEAPVNGEDAKLDFKIDLFSQAVGKQLEDGRLDYREINKYKVVLKDALILVKVPPTAGTPGKTVTGEPLECKHGKDVRVNTGKNVRVQADAQGGESFFAMENGAVIYSPERKFLDVQTELKIDGDVDFNTGNITFPGNIYVTGQIKSGFVVKASGKLVVGKCIDNAKVECSGDLSVKEGVVGQSLVKAGGQVQVSFIENSTIEAEGDVLVKDSVVDSHISTNGSLITNAILGGTVRAVHKISAANLGSALQPRTELTLGLTKELKERRAKMAEEAAFCEGNAEKIDQVLKHLDPAKLQALPAEKRAQVEQLAGNRAQLLARLAELKRAVEAADQIKAASIKGYVSAANNVHPGVVITINSERTSVLAPKQKVSFRFNETTFKVEECVYRE